MQKRLVIGLTLALSLAPLATHAALIGTPCDATQVGTTKMDTDQENIIACLKTGTNTPVYQWKSMSSDGGNQVQCAAGGQNTNTLLCVNPANGKVCQYSFMVGLGPWICLNPTGFNIN